MEKAQNFLYQLEKSINTLKIDFDLLEKFKSELKVHKIEPDNFEQEIKLLLHIYDLSNNEKLYTIRKNSISMNEMAVELKIMVCELMSNVINYFEKHQSITSIPIEFLAEGIEIMIISTRVCLNEGHSKFISQLQESYKLIHSPFEYVSEFLPKNTQFFHHLNTLELVRYKCENESFTILDFSKRLAIISSYDEIKISDYQNFVSNIVMEIVLKSLKNGKLSAEKAESFLPFMTEENQKDLESLIVATGNSTKNLETSSEFLEIYHQIQNYGIESINMDYLEEFIKTEKNFNDERIFEVTALTLEPEFLEIWFSILNSRKEKFISLEKAFLCYIHVVESILGEETSKKELKLSKLLKLSNTIIFTLLTEKKSAQNHHPVLNIIKTFMKVLTELCFSFQHEWKEISDFGERLVLICSRFQCMEVSKVIYTLMLYCSLIKKQKAQDIYEKFIAYYNNEQTNEIFKLLSSAYLLQNSEKENLSIESMKSLEMFKQPFIMVLFAQNEEDMTIFNIDLKDFKEINKKFLIYFEMIKKYQENTKNLTRILEHLENFVLKTRLDELNKIIEGSEEERVNLKNLLMLLVELLEEKETVHFQMVKNPSISHLNNENKENESKKKDENSNNGNSIKICFILLHLLFLSNPAIVNEVKESSTGVLLNKYSQKVKLIAGLTEILKQSNIEVETQIYNVCCCYLIIVLEKFKKSFIKKERIGEPGEISFIHAISDFVVAIQEKVTSENKKEEEKNEKKGSKSRMNQSTEDVKNTFILFVIFEIDCLTNNHEKYMKKVDLMSIPQLKTYGHSMYIPKNLKQKILRRIVKENLMQNGSDVTLREFKEIIEITEDSEELQLYMKYVFCSFGEEGRKMLLLLSHENKRLQRMLLNENEVEI